MRAQKVRTVAGDMIDPQVRETLLGIAQDYEVLALRAEARQQSILSVSLRAPFGMGPTLS
jgi:hypothetical protein